MQFSHNIVENVVTTGDIHVIKQGTLKFGNHKIRRGKEIKKEACE